MSWWPSVLPARVTAQYATVVMPTPPAATRRWNVDQVVGDDAMRRAALERRGLDDAVAQRDRTEPSRFERRWSRHARSSCVPMVPATCARARQIVTISLPNSTKGTDMLLVAYDYPLLNLFWTMLWLFFFVIWIWVLISVLIDVFRSHDLSGIAKALWLVFIVFLPVLGVLVYLIARGQQDARARHRRRQEPGSRVPQLRAASAGSGSTADELTKLADLRDKGVITAEQFEAQKAKLLA